MPTRREILTSATLALFGSLLAATRPADAAKQPASERHRPLRVAPSNRRD